MIVFVSGGARSGKSEVAERQTLEAANGAPCYYLATASISDADMAARVARHQARREAHWVTIEAPVALDVALLGVPERATVLLDCLTLWASQVLYSAGLSPDEGLALFTRALDEARRRKLTLVVVSNDLNEALLPDAWEVWRYVAFLQRVHCWLAVEADSVLEVVAGQAVEWTSGEHA